MNPIDFIKNILTDTYKDKVAMKVDALNVYTLLIQSNSEEAIQSNSEEAVLSIPFSGQVLSIPAVHYNEAFKLYQAGQKINVIKTIRCHGWIGSDKTATPELLFAKNFVESFPQPINTGR
jgi:hypothetical protein